MWLGYISSKTKALLPTEDLTNRTLVRKRTNAAGHTNMYVAPHRRECMTKNVVKQARFSSISNHDWERAKDQVKDIREAQEEAIG